MLVNLTDFSNECPMDALYWGTLCTITPGHTPGGTFVKKGTHEPLAVEFTGTNSRNGQKQGSKLDIFCKRRGQN